MRRRRISSRAANRIFRNASKNKRADKVKLYRGGQRIV